MHVMPGESLAHILPAALRVALGLPAVAAGSDAFGSLSDSEDEEGEDGRSEYRRRGTPGREKKMALGVIVWRKVL